MRNPTWLGFYTSITRRKFRLFGNLSSLRPWAFSTGTILWDGWELKQLATFSKVLHIGLPSQVDNIKSRVHGSPATLFSERIFESWRTANIMASGKILNLSLLGLLEATLIIFLRVCMTTNKVLVSLETPKLRKS